MFKAFSTKFLRGRWEVLLSEGSCSWEISMAHGQMASENSWVGDTEEQLKKGDD